MGQTAVLPNPGECLPVASGWTGESPMLPVSGSEVSECGCVPVRGIPAGETANFSGVGGASGNFAYEPQDRPAMPTHLFLIPRLTASLVQR